MVKIKNNLVRLNHWISGIQLINPISDPVKVFLLTLFKQSSNLIQPFKITLAYPYIEKNHYWKNKQLVKFKFIEAAIKRKIKELWIIKLLIFCEIKINLRFALIKNNRRPWKVQA